MSCAYSCIRFGLYSLFLFWLMRRKLGNAVVEVATGRGISLSANERGITLVPLTKVFQFSFACNLAGCTILLADG